MSHFSTTEVRIKKQGYKYNPAYIQLNLAYMKPEMYTFTRVMSWIDNIFLLMR